MKNYIDRILLGAVAVFAAVSCGQTQDTRFFAPELEFDSGSYSAAAESGAVDVALKFSRPAQMAFDVALMYGGTLEEGVQFKAPRSIDVAAGAAEAVVHIELVDDEIWDENSIIELFLVPGTRYTVNPDGMCQAKVNVSKNITVPVLRLTSRQESLEVNPYLAESLEFVLESNKAPSEALKVDLRLGGLVPGKDYLLDGAESSRLELPAGKTSLPFTIKFVQKDISGYDTTVALSLVPDKQHYVVASGDASPEIHLYDPVVDLGPLWKTAAQNNGTGYQIRQAIKAPDGS